MQDFLNIDDELEGLPTKCWQSAGPISDAFIKSNSFVSVLVGPVGSGKTTATIKKVIYEAINMPPTLSGERVYRFIWLREAYDPLWQADIASWLNFFPIIQYPDFVGSKSRPATHKITFRDKWGIIKIEGLFKALGEDVQADKESLRGLELTDAIFGEVDLQHKEIFDTIAQRVGRYPPHKELQKIYNSNGSIITRQKKVFASMNAPDIQNWVYKDFYEEPAEGVILFKQPSGLSKDAENLEFLTPNYYQQMATLYAKKPHYIRRMIEVKPGYVQENNVVYPEYDDDRNCVPDLKFYKELPLIIGIDAGLTPAAAFCQEMPDGQFRIIAEIALKGASETTFARAITTLLNSKFKDAECHIVCDPSASAGDGTEDGSWRSRLAKLLGIPIKNAQTNDPARRWGAIREMLERNLSGGRPGFLLDSSCFSLRRGFNQTYHFREKRGSNDITSVEKGEDSHSHDAAQYAALEAGTTQARLRRSAIESERKAKREKQNKTVRFNPLTRKYG